jgi:rSAM/selenodomain-associated transferase 1
MPSKTVIQVFAKDPQPGQVKTRLIPELGEDGATRIYRFSLNHALQLARESHFDYQLWLNQPSSDRLFEGFDTQFQVPGDLGKKMYHALSTALNSGTFAKAILIGSDCLDLTQRHLQRVNEMLDHYSLVIIPALDGGYVLIAASQSVDPEVFNNISWSSEQVLRQSLKQCMVAQQSVKLLNPLRDIDHAADLAHYPQLRSLTT